MKVAKRNPVNSPCVGGKMHNDFYIKKMSCNRIIYSTRSEDRTSLDSRRNYTGFNVGTDK